MNLQHRSRNAFGALGRLAHLPLAGIGACLMTVAVFTSPRLVAADVTVRPTEITARHMESVSTDKEMTTVFEGDVTIVGTNITITCERLVVISLRKGPKDQVVAKQNQFKSLVATGRVKINQGDREATCGRAVVLPGEDRITLTENPMVIDPGAGATWIGDELYILRGERMVKGTNAKLILPPVKDLGPGLNKALDPARQEGDANTPAVKVPLIPKP